MRRAHLKDNMNQAAFLSLMPTGVRGKTETVYSGDAPVMGFRVPVKGIVRMAGVEHVRDGRCVTSW